MGRHFSSSAVGLTAERATHNRQGGGSTPPPRTTRPRASSFFAPIVQRQNIALVARRRRVGTAWEPQFRSIVQKIGHKPAKLEIPVQVGVDRPFFPGLSAIISHPRFERGLVRVGVPPCPPLSSAWREQIRQPPSKRPYGGATPPVETFGRRTRKARAPV